MTHSRTPGPYVFTRDGTTWSQQAKLTPSDAEAFDWFGACVAIHGDTLLVSGDQDANNGAGAVHVFTRSGRTWTERTRLTTSDRATGDRLNTISFDGDIAMFGAYGDDDNGEDSGSVYVFEAAEEQRRK